MTGGKILVIKTGALGDFIQALGAMQAIRRHHPDDHLTLLTTGPLAGFGAGCGYFNDIWLDPRPRDAGAWAGWRRRLRGAGFMRVYDLQNSDRTALYSWLFWPRRPDWVGAAPFASHRNTSPERTAGHALDGHAQTLAMAGIANVAVDALDWVQGDAASFALPVPFALLIPGCSPVHPRKRWPAAHYGALAVWLMERGITPVIIGTADEAAAAAAIAAACPAARDLVGRTDLFDLVRLARGAALAVGNDTGPMHLVAAAGCPALTLFSDRSDPARMTPKGKRVAMLQEADLNDLPVAAVIDALQHRLNLLWPPS